MSGEYAHQEHRPREHRQLERQSGTKSDSEGGSNVRNRNRRSGSGGARKSIYRFDDQLEHDICQLVTHQAPKGFPAISRTGLATIPPVAVARTEARVLLCDGLHEGPHVWPNGDLTVDDSVAAVVVRESVGQ